MNSKKLVFEEFPNSKAEPFEQTSPASGTYNCIAWALEDDKHFYWPGAKEFYNWPPDLPRVISIKRFVNLFAKFDYQPCHDVSFEKGFQKIALFAKDGRPTHAARQLPDGFWTSKIGTWEDVRHTLKAMSGGMYGDVTLVFKRPNVEFGV